MNGEHCCSSQKITTVRRCLAAGKWVAPGFFLAVLPKCPLCLAGYVAMGTGIGLTFSTASYFRAMLIILCLAPLTFYVVRALWRYVSSSSPNEQTSNVTSKNE